MSERIIDDNRVHQLPSPNDCIILTATFPGFTPETLYDFWTQPDHIRKWWADRVSDFTPQVGAHFEIVWRGSQRGLKGRYRRLERGVGIAFTGQCNHVEWERDVEIALRQWDSVGTLLTLNYGPFQDTPEDQRRREEMLGAWREALTVLRTLRPDARGTARQH